MCEFEKSASVIFHLIASGLLLVILLCLVALLWKIIRED